MARAACFGLIILAGIIQGGSLASEMPQPEPEETPAAVGGDHRSPGEVGNDLAQDRLEPAGTFTGLDVFAEALGSIEKAAKSHPSRQRLIQAAIRGMLAMADEESVYLEPEFQAALQDNAYEALGGLPVEVTRRDGRVLVVSPFRGSRAAALLVPGEELLSLGPHSLAGVSLTRYFGLLRRYDGEELQLTVQNEAGEVRTVKVQRETMHGPSLLVERFPEGVVAVRVRSLDNGISADLEAILSQHKTTLTAFILDLRGSPGGRLDEAMAIADLFLSEGPLATVVNGDKTLKSFSAEPGGIGVKLPMVLLVDRGTAGASELLALVLQARGVARCFGSTTFGKGSVQATFPLPDGGSMRFTVGELRGPRGENFHSQGFKPAVSVETKGRRLGSEAPDPQFEAARAAAVGLLKEVEKR